MEYIRETLFGTRPVPKVVCIFQDIAFCVPPWIYTWFLTAQGYCSSKAREKTTTFRCVSPSDVFVRRNEHPFHDW